MFKKKFLDILIMLTISAVVAFIVSSIFIYSM